MSGSLIGRLGHVTSAMLKSVNVDVNTNFSRDGAPNGSYGNINARSETTE